MAVGIVISVLAAAVFFPLFTLIFCAFLFVQNQHKKYNSIPGPKRDSFIWGNFKNFESQRSKKARFLVFEDLVLKYGPVLLTWDMYEPIVTVSDPELLKSIQKPSDFKDVIFSGNFKTIFEERFIGKGGRFNNCGVFDEKIIKKQLKNFNSCCGAILNELEERSNGKDEVKMAEQFSRLSVDLIAKVAFGFDLCSVHDSDVPFYNALQACQEGSWWSVCNLFHKWDISSFEYQSNVTEAVKYLRDFGKKVIDSRKSAIEDGEPVLEDYLTCMIRAGDVDSSITLDDMLDEFVTVFIIGKDQLTSLMSNFLLELFKRPMIEEKLYEEVINIVQQNEGVTLEDLDKLIYMFCVTKETLRLNPPIPAVQWQTEKSVNIGCHLIPEETKLQIIPYILQTDPKVWKNPKEFNPERFMESKDIGIATQLPYSLRKHCYINGSFAECLIKALYPCLLQKFKLVLVPGQDVRPQEEFTVIPKDGVLCTLTLI